jgi:hypothetical protein
MVVEAGWPICVVADGARLARMVYVSKILYGVRVSRKSFCYGKIVFFLGKLYGVVID